MGQKLSREGEPHLHRAIHSRNPCTLIITNASPHKVKIFWHNYLNHRLQYFILAPGGFYHQPTFHTHPWSFEVATEHTQNQPPNTIDVYPSPEAPKLVTAGDRHQQVFYATGSGAVEHVTIELAETVPWSTEVHCQWFKKYIPAVWTVLMAANRNGGHGGNKSTTTSPTPAVSNGGEVNNTPCNDTNNNSQASELTVYDSVGSLELLTETAGQRRAAVSSVGRALRKIGSKQCLAAGGGNGGRGGGGRQPYCILSELPKPLLLIILEKAAPEVWNITRPALPYSAHPENFAREERRDLFLQC